MFVEPGRRTLGRVEALELDGLCVVDHGGEVRVDVSGGSYICVLCYQSLLRVLCRFSSLSTTWRVDIGEDRA